MGKKGGFRVGGFAEGPGSKKEKESTECGLDRRGGRRL